MALSVPAAERTLQLLELLLRNPDGLSPQEFLVQIDLSRSSLFSLLQTLKSLGYVEQNNPRGRYTAGARLLSWRRIGAGETSDLLTAFFQETSHFNFEETIALILPGAEACMVLAQVESSHVVHSSFEIGQNLSLETSTAGPLFLSTPPGNISKQAYHLQQTEEVTEIALPVCSDGLHPVAALMLSGPSYRFSKEKALAFHPALSEIASRISYHLGAHIYQPYLNLERSPISPTMAMSIKEIEEFLKGPWAARLGCLRPDGTPHVVPIWYEFRNDRFYIAAWQTSMWATYIRQNPNTSLTVDEPWPPLRRVFARTKAIPIEKKDLPGGLDAFLDRLSKRYLSRSVEPSLLDEEWHTFQLFPDHLSGWRGLHMAI